MTVVGKPTPYHVARIYSPVRTVRTHLENDHCMCHGHFPYMTVRKQSLLVKPPSVYQVRENSCQPKWLSRLTPGSIERNTRAEVKVSSFLFGDLLCIVTMAEKITTVDYFEELLPRRRSYIILSFLLDLHVCCTFNLIWINIPVWIRTRYVDARNWMHQ
jgi:hypothetical protein